MLALPASGLLLLALASARPSAPVEGPQALLPSAVLKPAELRSSWFGQSGERSLLVLETDRPLDHRGGSIDGRRLALNLADLESAALSNALVSWIPAAHPYIVHAAVGSGGQLEMAFNRPVRAEIFLLEPAGEKGHRLVLDLRALPVEPVQRTGAPASASPGPEGRKKATGRPVPDLFPQDEIASGPAAPSTQESGQAPPTSPPPSLREEAVQRRQEMEQLWLDVSLNDQSFKETVLALLDTDGKLLLAREDLRRLRLEPEQGDEYNFQGQGYHSLAQLGIEYQMDRRRMSLKLEAPAGLFGETRMHASGEERYLPNLPATGGFLNYDFSFSGSRGSLETRGLFEAGFFNRWGSGASSFLAGEGVGDKQAGMIRLDSTWRWDDPLAMKTLRLGDTFSRGTGWSGSVRFGGLQWGTNFETQPELVTMPMLDFAGEAALPSTVDLYINDALRLSRQVPPGPFSIRNVPQVAGTGQARLVIRDMLGREQLITRRFHSSSSLLREGLEETSYGAGFIRENYGVASNDYGRFMINSTRRQGVTKQFTLESNIQLLREQQTTGLGGIVLLPGQSSLHSALAFSRTEGKAGGLARLGLQKEGEDLSLGIDTQFTSQDFARLGASRGDNPLPLRELRAFATLSPSGRGSLNLSYTRQDYRAGEDLAFLSAGYNVSLGSFGYLNLSALHFFEKQESAFYLHFSLPLGGGRSTASLDAGKDGSRIQIQRGLPTGEGYGYGLQAGLTGNDSLQGHFNYQNDYGRWQVEASRADGQSGLRAGAQGGLILLEGDLFASRAVRESFGLVRVPGHENVRIYADNQLVARTNRHGNALVPDMRPYESNRIRIEQADLPLDARVSVLQMQARPSYRQGVVLDFPVERSRDAFFRLLLEDGSPLPLGAVVKVEDGDLFPVGRRGEVYLMNLAPLNRLQASWQGQSCSFTLEVPESDNPILDLGSVTCAGSRSQEEDGNAEL